MSILDEPTNPYSLDVPGVKCIAVQYGIEQGRRVCEKRVKFAEMLAGLAND